MLYRKGFRLGVVLVGMSGVFSPHIARSALLPPGMEHVRDTRVITCHYDAWSRVMDTALPGGVDTSYQYDSYGQLISLRHTYGKHRSKLISRFTYFYTKDASITERERTDGLGRLATEHYTYDANHNLKTYVCSGALCPRDAQGNVIAYQQYIFDALNNIKRVVSNHAVTSYDYNKVNPVRLLGYHDNNAANVVLIYDKNGNIIQDDQGSVIVYNPFNQAQSVTTQKGVTHYIYNGVGQQVGEQIPEHPVTYFTYGQNAVLNTQSANEKTSVLYGLNRLGEQNQQGIQYDLGDQNHSIVATVTQAPGDLEVKQYRYSPYGIESVLGGLGNALMPLQHFGFDGQLTDSQTSWQFLGQGYRAYNPTLHRFMSADSFSPFEQGGLNGYAFGSNNPVMMSDPSGHMSLGMNMGLGLMMGMVAGLFTSEIGGWGAVAVDAIFGAVGSNLDTIGAGVQGRAIHLKQVGIRAGVGAILGALGGSIGGEDAVMGEGWSMMTEQNADLLAVYNRYPQLKGYPILGQGCTGIAFRQGDRVLKAIIPRAESFEDFARLDVDRTVKIWNDTYMAIDPAYATARNTNGLLDIPFVKGRKANIFDFLRIRRTVGKMYQETGRVFADAKFDNFVIHNNEAYPIDVDMSPRFPRARRMSIGTEAILRRPKTNLMTRLVRLIYL